MNNTSTTSSRLAKNGERERTQAPNHFDGHDEPVAGLIWNPRHAPWCKTVSLWCHPRRPRCHPQYLPPSRTSATSTCSPFKVKMWSAAAPHNPPTHRDRPPSPPPRLERSRRCGRLRYPLRTVRGPTEWLQNCWWRGSPWGARSHGRQSSGGRIHSNLKARFALIS